MRQENRSLWFGKITCAVVLAFVMAVSPLMDGAAAAKHAFAAPTEGSTQPQQEPAQDTSQEAKLPTGDTGGESGGATSGGSPALDGSPAGSQESGQFTQEVPLGTEEASTTPPPKSDAGDAAGSASSSHVNSEVPLSKDNAPATTGYIMYEGLKYKVQPDGRTVELAGFGETAPKGDVVVPASVPSGVDRYAVVAVTKHALAQCSEVKTVLLPATVECVADGAFEGCSELTSLEVNTKNAAFSSHDGMLFDAAGEKLLLCPEGKKGTAVLPATVQDVHPDAFEKCSKLTALEIAASAETQDAAAYACQDGILYTADMTTLVYRPAGAGDAAVIAPETQAIAEKAFAESALAAITALGNVTSLAPDAFTPETKANAVVALPAGEDYDQRKAVWEEAGFSKFAQPATPGDVETPSDGLGDGEGATEGEEPGEEEAQQSGFTFTLLDNYTLSVAWSGTEDPAANVVIPASASMGGVTYNVTHIAASGFANRASVQSVELPASVTTLEEGAFAGCVNLTSVQLPASLQEIGARVFEATGIVDTWLPASVQAVGERAFAGSSSLTRIVAQGNPWVADSALESCANVTVYCPANAENTYNWNMGLPASNNHLAPYGVSLIDEPLQLEVGQSANLFDGGTQEVPAGTELAYAYAAKPISVDAGSVTGKAAGSSEVSVILSLDNTELARASRTVEVVAVPTPAPEAPEPDNTEQAPADNENLDNPSENQAPIISETHALESKEEAARATRDALAPVSETVMFSTLTSFEQEVASGQTLKFTILTEDTTAKTGTVSVAKSADAEKEPTGALVIPKSVTNGGIAYKVTAVENIGFDKAWLVTSVSFEEGIELSAIGTQAFSSMVSCRSFNIPPTVTSLGDRVFAYCNSLKYISIPSLVKVVGEGLFLQCAMLEVVELGSQVTALPKTMFSYCTDLTTVRVWGEVSSIQPTSFFGTDTGNTTVFIQSVKGESAWNTASQVAGLSFKDVLVQSDVCEVTFDAQGGSPSLQKVTVGKGSTLAEPMAPIKAGASVAGWFTDPECSDDARWVFTTSVVTAPMTLYAKWVEEVREGDLIYRMRSDGKSLSIAAADPATFSGDLIVPQSHNFGNVSLSVKEIAPLGFSKSQVKTVFIPHSIEVIGADAFKLSTALRSVEFESGGSLSVIEGDAFRDCASLIGIRIPSSVSKMGRNVFEKCTSLTSVEFEPGSKLSLLESAAFASCTSLESIVLPDHFTSINASVFVNCTSLTSVTCPTALRTIGLDAFGGCTALTQLEMNSVESIDTQAFRESGLTSVVIPESVTFFGTDVFSNCISLASVNLQSLVKPVSTTAFRNCSAISAIYADGSMPDAGISAAFDATVKANATVFLPQTSADGTETFAQMKTDWEGYGFKNVVCSGGALPMVDNKGAAHWYVEPNPATPGLNTLVIEQTEAGTIDGLSNWDQYPELPSTDDYWKPLNENISKIIMRSADTEKLSAKSSAEWFSGMSKLSDVTEAYVPSGVSNVKCMFDNCKSLTYIPDSFTLPDTVTDALAMFRDCPLSAYPKGLTHLPSGIEFINSMFAGTEIDQLPDGFTLKGYPKLWNMNWAFKDTMISTLPKGFELPENGGSFERMFAHCQNLTSLPEGFSIPVLSSSVPDDQKGGGVAEMFRDCPKLTYLPDSLNFEEIKNMNGFDTMFGWVAVTPPAETIQMYYAGTLPVDVAADKWAGRYIHTGANKPEGSSLVSFALQNSDGSYPADPWLASLTDGNGILAEVTPPSRDGQVFTLWYADKTCTKRFDFSKPVADQATAGTGGKYALYGKYEAGTHCGALPTVGNKGIASWSLTDAGTLYIRGDGKITDLAWPANDYKDTIPRSGYWAPYRDEVQKVVMRPGMEADSVREWFSGMPNLANVEAVYVPEGVTSTAKMFTLSGSITAFPEGFNLPSSVKNAARMFYGCGKLGSLPSGFTLPSGIESCNTMFAKSGLYTLPEGFSVPVSASNARYMFFWCKALTYLPASFVIAGNSRTDFANCFNGCVSLASLPEGFTFPENYSFSGTGENGVNRMFMNCRSLTMLPSGFAIPENLKNTVSEKETFKCDIEPGQPRIPTYYSGTDPNVLSFDWESQGRTLITDSADAGDRGMQQVQFKVQDSVASADGTFQWKTRSTAFTNKEGIAADPGAPITPGFTFTGWHTDEDCTDPFDFTTQLTETTTLYGKWIQFGGKNKSQGQEGWLPVEAPDGGAALPGASAWWYITADGVLRVACENGASIGDLEWRSEGGYQENWDRNSKGYWGPYRKIITRVIMGADVQARTMEAWFSLTTKLKVADIVIPKNTTTLYGLFDYAESLEILPVSFALPEEGNLKDLGRMFRYCYKLKELPETFVPPSSVITIMAMLEGTPISKLPEGFTVPVACTNVGWLFTNCKQLKALPDDFRLSPNTKITRSMLQGCESLTSLPTGFSISANVDSALQMFYQCKKLASLPEGFCFEVDEIGKRKAPINVSHMFTGCDSLTYIPSSFNLNVLTADTSNKTNYAANLNTMFTTPSHSVDNPLVTYFAGEQNNIMPSDWGTEASTPADYWTTLMHRKMTPISELPVERALVSFLLPDASTQAYDTTKPYMSVVTDANGLLGEQMAPVFDGREFLGWYTSQECTTKFDFTKSVSSQLSAPYLLYGKYLERRGTLPTTDGQQNASWEITPDGTLRIDCQKDKIISKFGWNPTEPSLNHWAPLSNLVTRIEMGSDVKAEKMTSWFKDMRNLTDITGVFIPVGTEDIYGLFQNCTSLKTVPESFVIPEGVKSAGGLFQGSGIITLPEGFTLPSSVTFVQHMFHDAPNLQKLPASFVLPAGTVFAEKMFTNCTSLRSLPDGFTLPSTMQECTSMFEGCSSLIELPSGFTLGEKVANTNQMFKGCTSLATLPEGFNIPSGISGSVAEMFAGCSALVSLPSSLDLTGFSAKTGHATMFAGLSGFGSTNPLSTYVAGGDLSKLNVDGTKDAAEYWLDTYSRELVVDSANLPTGVKPVTFKTKTSGDAAFTTWQTVLSDASGKVSAPADPSKYGYVFAGWFTDEACTTEFNFEASTITEDTTLYGTYTLVVSVDVPTGATVSIDATGAVKEAPLTFKSRTAVPLNVTRVDSSLAPGASLLFPDATQRNGVDVSIGFKKNTVAVTPGGSTDDATGFIAGASIPAASSASPGLLEGKISLQLNGAQPNYQAGDDMASFARLTWAIEVKK